MKLQDDLLYIKEGNIVYPSPYTCTILEFKDLTSKELAFVYFMTDHRSAYSVYEWDQREIEVKTSVFGDTSKWSPSPKVLGACEKYEKLIETSAVRLLKNSKFCKQFYDHINNNSCRHRSADYWPGDTLYFSNHQFH